MILFKFMREMGIVIGLQDCVRMTRSFCIKTKKPTSLKWVFDEGFNLCEQAIFL